MPVHDLVDPAVMRAELENVLARVEQEIPAPRPIAEVLAQIDRRGHLVDLSERELRLIRFGLERALEGL